MADREKDRIISKVYFADGGFGSARETLKDVRETSPEITLKDVQEWREKYIPRKAPMRGFNSYMPRGANSRVFRNWSKGWPETTLTR